MRIVIFGLSISSAWGNGHASLLRGLFRALHELGHHVDFFERDTPYYAGHRDATSFPFVDLHLYTDWTAVKAQAQQALRAADVGMVTSYCADGAEACRLVLDTCPPRTVFYDMDTPVTLERLARREAIPYIPSEGLSGFDLVLSYTGGTALEQLQERLGAARVAALYGWVDPAIYYPGDRSTQYAADLSYLGTYAADRQRAMEDLLIACAQQMPEKRFVIGGAMYPNPKEWPKNVRHFEHVVPGEHRSFYSSSPLTLNITRGSMAAMGYCPSGRLFEAAACGTALLSDWWVGLDTFFEPGEEIFIATSTSDAIAVLREDPERLQAVAERARQRVLDSHTAEHRARRFLRLVEDPSSETAELPQAACSGKEA